MILTPPRAHLLEVVLSVYDEAAPWYDRVWGARRDYTADVAAIIEQVRRHHRRADRLLDLACGTGGHLQSLTDHYTVAGLDLSRPLLDLASTKLPADVPLYEADMLDFDLDQRFDVITCLWGSIAYAETEDGLGRVAERIAAHLERPGLAIIEPWLTDDAFEDPGRVTVTVDDDQSPVVTVVGSVARDGAVADLRRVYVAAVPGQLDVVEEHHRLGLFSRGQYRAAFDRAGFDTDWEDDGLTGRGLIIGRLS